MLCYLYYSANDFFVGWLFITYMCLGGAVLSLYGIYRALELIIKRIEKKVNERKRQKRKEDILCTNQKEQYDKGKRCCERKTNSKSRGAF